MPSAERLSSKFHSSPRSFASRPIVHFSDNYPPMYQPPKGVYLLNMYIYIGILEISCCHLADYVKNCIKLRASRAGRLLFLIQPIILLAIFWRCRLLPQ